MFPDAWKLARVVPVPKSTDVSMPSNYRPISILSIISNLKVLKRITYRKLYHHLCLNWPIFSKQWGFLLGRSTNSALLSVTHGWLQQLDQGLDIRTVYFDLQKAFDSVPDRHQQIVMKSCLVKLGSLHQKKQGTQD